MNKECSACGHLESSHSEMVFDGGADSRRCGDCDEKRIRELEAALEMKTTWWLNEKARAEKAEARVAELTEHLGVGHECTHRFHVEAREREAE